MTIRDLTELDRQIDNAEAHALDADAPGRNWDQELWFSRCGTYGCLAGNTVLDAGWVRASSYNGQVWKPGTGEPSQDIRTVAMAALGLTGDEAEALFHGSNTIAVLRRLQKDLHDGQPIDAQRAVQYQDEERRV